MADIYLVLASTEAGVDRHLVLKRVLAERSRDPVFAQMFLDEARLAAQLQHPNIAQVYDVGKLDGAYFFTMEYVHGEDIRGIMRKIAKKKEPLPENLALYIASGALAALHHAHERTTPDGKPLNIVHRDVSPSNVMVGYEGVIKLVDFGVAKASERSQESRAGAIKGKISYVSPEQCKGQHIDRRSDIYSLGIVMWEMLTGRRLYKRESDFLTMLAVTNEEVPRPSTLRPDLSPEIERIVMTALEKDREKRFPTAAAMLEEIEAVATLERHLMSGSAMARFMKEHFGTKPEPWVGLPAVDTQAAEPAEPVTVTNQSLPGLGVAVSQRVSQQMLVVDGLQNMLEHAPDLRRADTSPVDGSDSRPSISEGSRQSQPSLSAASLQVPQLAVPAPMPAAPPRRRSGWVILLALVGTLGGAVGGMYLYKESKALSTGSEPSTATVAMTPVKHDDTPAVADDKPAQPVETKPAEEKPAEAKPAETVTPAPPATIADAVGKQDWETALQLCAVGATAKDVASCGLAACNFKRKDQALLYYGRASGREQAGIEQACRVKGIALVTHAPVAKPRPKPPTKSDPCKDPAYVEANPLKCQ